MPRRPNFRQKGDSDRVVRGLWRASNGRSDRRYALSDLRIMVWAGLILGLLAFQAIRFVPEARPDEIAPFPAVPTDPFAESKRSKAILEAQEGAPELFRPAGGREYRGAIHVVDGDTFDAGGERIRIADIDTPEIQGRCALEIRMAARATERMRALLQAGPFELHPISGRDEDRYGRKLRIVTRNGRSLGDQLVAEGLARTWSGRRQPWC